MTWMDVTLPLRPGMVVYDGDPPPTLWRYATVSPETGEGWSATYLAMGSHTGTHVDAPRHFFAEGLPVDRIGPEVLCGPALVADLRGGPRGIDAAALSPIGLSGVERLLLRTHDGELWDRPSPGGHAHLTEDGARILADAGLCLLGIDTLSVEAASAAGHPVHHRLLGSAPPVIVVEGLDLRRVAAGPCEIVVLPLRLEGGDGAPARAFLRRA
jgi:arylformamidase